MQFDFSTTPRIIFGSGKLSTISSLVNKLGKTVLIIFNGPVINLDPLFSQLNQAGLDYACEKISHEPDIDSISLFVDLAKTKNVDLIIGFGGGSAIDSAKATAVLVNNPGPIIDYFEVIGKNLPIRNSALPMVAIPTTAGTGAEVTKNAVVGFPEQNIKVSLRGYYLFPRIALVDPELTLSLPKQPTAFSGLDALTQLIEAYTCNIPNPMTDILCLEGIRRVRNSIYQAYDNGSILSSREEMAFASLLGGISLTNAKLGAVHGLAGPLGGDLNAPHGAICAALLPHVIEQNINALMERAPNNISLKRYAEIALILTNDTTAGAEAGINWIRDFCVHTQIPKLSAFGLNITKYNSIIDKAIQSNSMKGNPITLFDSEIRNILNKAL